MNYKEARPWFKFFAGILLFLLGLSLVVKNFYFFSEPSGYEIIFGVQCITAGVWLVDGKFRGIGKPTEHNR
jgi:hypothetical protein